MKTLLLVVERPPGESSPYIAVLSTFGRLVPGQLRLGRDNHYVCGDPPTAVVRWPGQTGGSLGD